MKSVEPKALISSAKKARARAYAPYSRFLVGAAVEGARGVQTVGANVENASYGLTMCAERNAIAAALAQGMKPGELKRVVVVTQAERPTPPCGACRQVLAEFGTANTEIWLHNLKSGESVAFSLGELLPQAFLRGDLP
jgi:homotetrameric cytidine deaminase